MTTTSPLPEFSSPPVVETVLSTRFRKVPQFNVVHMARFWEQYLSTDLPLVEQQPPYPAPMEQFGAQMAPFNFELAAGFPAPRLWFSKDSELVQLQEDWFAYNWRRASDSDSYTRYRRNRETFSARLSDLVSYFGSIGAEFVPVQCEVTYVNQIPLAEADLEAGPFGRTLKAVHPTAGKVLPAPFTADFGSSYLMTSEDGDAVGHLHVKAERAFSPSGEPTVLLNLTARGAPMGPGVEGVLAFCDVGRNWIVAGFEDLTTDLMHSRWGITEERNEDS